MLLSSSSHLLCCVKDYESFDAYQESSTPACLKWPRTGTGFRTAKNSVEEQQIIPRRRRGGFTSSSARRGGMAGVTEGEAWQSQIRSSRSVEVCRGRSKSNPD